MSSVTVGTVKIRTACVPLLKDNLNRISVLYAAHLIEKVEGLAKDGFTELEVYTTSYATDLLVRVQRYVDDICRDGCTTTTLHLQHQQQQPALHQISHLLTDSSGVGGCGVLSGAGGDDSSYDSDYENDTPSAPVGGGKQVGPGSSPGCIGSAAPVGHQLQQLYHHDVSRTTSDTLAAEYADYVQTYENNDVLTVATAPGYTARVEFALKLGYTERLVQTALAKLGPAPAQNELLAELIKLGAQRGVGGGGPGSASSDGSGSPIESLLGIDGTIDATTSPLVAGFAAAQNIATSLRPIVIDGSNVAMSHGNKEIFSCRGIKICVDYFRSRGHRDITVFVPKWRKEAPRPDNPVQDQEILAELERERLLVFTPSRLVGGKRTVCYDDRYILKLATQVDGIVVSNDNYRDLCQENTEYRRVVDERVLMYTFVNDRFMPPDDPLGRAGPTLDNFLKLSGRNSSSIDSIVTPPPCPYAKKCTYGNKCKYHHPERGPLPHKSVTERLSEHAQRHLQARDSCSGSTGPSTGGSTGGKIPLGRTRSVAPSGQPENMVAAHATVAKSRSVDACVNLHRKLQRQLTLNPGLAQQSYYVPYWDQPAKSQQQQRPSSTTSLQQSHLQHQLHQQYLQHQHVTRIASAPDAPHHHHQQRVAPLWPPPSAAATSCSEPQLWPPQQHNAGLSSPTGSVASHREDARRRMHYHLAAIFPEEQVARAMRLYPEETNPQTICAAILSMQQQCRK